MQLQHGYKDDITYRATRRRVHESASALAAMASELGNDEAAKLVQLNYRIVSKLSALASHRSHLQSQENLSHFCQTATNIQQLMQKTLKADDDEISIWQEKIRQSGKSDMQEESLPRKSLMKIPDLLADITATYQAIGKQT